VDLPERKPYQHFRNGLYASSRWEACPEMHPDAGRELGGFVCLQMCSIKRPQFIKSSIDGTSPFQRYLGGCGALLDFALLPHQVEPFG